jgi:hypothetical protein
MERKDAEPWVDLKTSVLVSTEEAAKFLGLSAATLRGWRCQSKNLRFYTVSRQRVKYDLADLERFKLACLCVPSVPHTTGLYAALQKSA